MRIEFERGGTTHTGKVVATIVEEKDVNLRTTVQAIGTIIGQTICFFIFPHEPLTNHVCTCEYCKVTRQLEAIEVVDSVIHDRIVINIEKED